jgi:hypothetical protein
MKVSVSDRPFQEAVMSGTFRRRVEHKAPRALIPTLAIAGVGAAVAFAAAVPATAIAATPHHAMSAHHVSSKHHARHLVVKGIVAGHHGRTVMVFARTAKVGTTVRHNERLRITFLRSATHARTKLRTGNHISLAATGIASRHDFRISRDQDETVTPAPAALLFGTVEAINANVLTISENDRDNGDHHDGDDNDNDGGHDGDNDAATPADHSPGGPGDGDNGQGHQVMVDDTAATILVDGAAGTIAVGDTVAVLGEAMDNTVIASTVWAFSTPQSFMRSEVQQVSGDNVTVRDDGNTSVVSLTGVPLALNGDVGATPSELVSGDKLLVVGSLNTMTGQVTPELAFAFNDNDNNPCGDNHDHGDHGDGGDGGSDG